jgi:hypothetical protein
MALADTIQKQVWKGYALAGGILGTAVTQYRPSGPLDPLSPGNIVSITLKASFDPDTYKYGKSGLYGKPIWYALVDGSQIETGDYLRTPAGDTYFVAALQHLLPIACVRCDRTIWVRRPFSADGVGALSYGGDEAGQETAIMSGWPASVLQGTKGGQGEVKLPGDERMPWYVVLLPAVPEVQIKSFDVLADDLGRRYKVSSAELTGLGWRLTAALAQT